MYDMSAVAGSMDANFLSLATSSTCNGDRPTVGLFGNRGIEGDLTTNISG